MPRTPLIHRLAPTVWAIALAILPASIEAAESVDSFRFRVAGTVQATSDSRAVESGEVIDALSSSLAGSTTTVGSSQSTTTLISYGNYGSVYDPSNDLIQHSYTGDEDLDLVRLADDLQASGQTPTRVLSDVNGDGVIESDEVVGIIYNFGDLHTFNVFFDHAVVDESRQLRSIEVAKQHVFSQDPSRASPYRGWRVDAYDQSWSVGIGDEVVGRMPLARDSGRGVSGGILKRFLDEMRWSTYGTLGLRTLEIEDRFHFLGTGSILGRTEVETIADHDVIGPQLGCGVVAESGIWRFEAVALGLVGHGRVEFVQRGIFGEEAVPGALNRPATARATVSEDYEADDYVAWHGETRLTAGCQLTQNLRFDATWRWYATSDVHEAGLATAWNAPDFGVDPPTGKTEYADDWFFGLTYVH